MTKFPQIDGEIGKPIQPSSTIGFRVNDEVRRALNARAASFGRSANDLARQYVIEALSMGEERTALREEVSRLRAEITSLRVDVALAAKTLLVSAGKIEPHVAERWVEENLASANASDL